MVLLLVGVRQLNQSAARCLFGDSGENASKLTHHTRLMRTMNTVVVAKNLTPRSTR